MPQGVFVPARAEDLVLSFASGFDSAAQGSVPYRNASSRYTALTPGTSGQVLTTQGAGANPIWSTPAATLDSLTDVNLPTASQGDVLYRNATEWVRLVAGTSGQALLTQGAGANPVWGAPAADLSTAVILAPTVSSRNVVQATGTGVIPLVLKRFGTSTSHLQDWQDNSATALAFMSSDGGLTCAADSATGRISMQQFSGYAGFWTGASAAAGVPDFTNYSMLAYNDGVTVDTFFNASGTLGRMFFRQNNLTYLGIVSGKVQVSTNTSGAGDATARLAVLTENTAKRGISITGVASQTADYFRITDSNPVPIFQLDAQGDFFWDRPSSTLADRLCAWMRMDFTGADAVRLGRLRFGLFDYNAGATARVPLTLGADGTNPTVGFLGAPPVARPSAYTLTGSATRTMPVDPSSAYTGAADGEAKLTDLNTLRGVVSSLLGVMRQHLTDMGHNSGFGLLNA